VHVGVWRYVKVSNYEGIFTVLAVLKGVRMLLCTRSRRSCARGVGEYAMFPRSCRSLYRRCWRYWRECTVSWAAVKDIRCVLKVLEVVNDVRHLPWV